MDPEMARPIQAERIKHKVELHLNETVAGFESGGDHLLSVKLKSGVFQETDLVILSIGVQPETGLAREAGLDIGQGGGIRVNKRMQTSDDNIWAVGDAVEVEDFISGHRDVIPLAGPANRQGRIAADVIMGRDAVFRGVRALRLWA
jgi:NADPH-dependent 2,4-dienoyl-CoA reductase/sulfur reductase-like enzyme